MVKVTPRRYVLSDREALDLYFVGDVGTFDRERPDLWMGRWRHGAPYNERPLAGGFYGTEIFGDPDEVARWTEAQKAVVAALREAEAQWLHDRGLIEVRDEWGRQLRRALGWRALARRWSPRRPQRALARHRQRLRRIDGTYRPVRDEIQTRVWETEQQARKRRERIQAVAARAWWRYRVDHAGGVVHIIHEDGATLDTWTLTEELLEVRRQTGVANLRWDKYARSEVAHSSGVDFDTWWRAVTPRPWTDSRTIPPTQVDQSGRTAHISAHTSFGIGSSPPGPHF